MSHPNRWIGDLAADDETSLAAVADLHVLAFPDSVLGRLGSEAVRRYYHWQLTGPHDLVALLARSDSGPPVAFFFGGVFRGSTIGFLKRNRWFLLGRVIRHPGVFTSALGLRRLALAGRLLVRRPDPPAPEQPADVPRRSFGVLAVGVHPTEQGHGVGRALMAEAALRARDAGFERMHLSVHPTNRRAVDFYRDQGWTEVSEPDGTWAGRMSLEL